MRSEIYKPFQPFLSDVVLESKGVTLEERPPSNLLSGIVHSYLQVTTTKPIRYSVMPDGMEAFYISSCGVKISGFQERAFELNLPKPGQYFGVRFHPGGLQSFLDIKSSVIASKIVDVDSVCDEKFDLHHQLYQRTDFNSRAHFVDSWLLQKFAPPQSLRFDTALQEIYKVHGSIAVAELAKKVGLSSRHLNRIFQSYTGLSTKAFIQIIRVQCACKMAWEAESRASDLAHDLGYFDQSHLLNDYKKRIRTNPSGLFSRLMSDFSNH
ncbi:helix-turn-helix domain-containing protein [Vibrio amylolyticus]|uniref:helix-turn-helix domain-containing protein n=1 Tax=Vibrio amylolyticus TaxID=2847292 RepID=UPI00355071CA